MNKKFNRIYTKNKYRQLYLVNNKKMEKQKPWHKALTYFQLCKLSHGIDISLLPFVETPEAREMLIKNIEENKQAILKKFKDEIYGALPKRENDKKT